MTRSQLFIIRGPAGHAEAIHQRTDRGPKDKDFAWWSLGPDGQPVASLQGRKVESLPLFGSQHVAKWDTSRRVFLVEGERDVLALAEVGHRALGTLGAAIMPAPGALAVLVGLHVALWPDNDAAGQQHMLKIARAIEPAAASLRWVTWRAAPAGGGAADYLAAGLRMEDLKLVPVPAPEPTQLIHFEARRKFRARFGPINGRPIEAFNNQVGVSEVLRRDFGIEARPGRAVRCPFHDDRHPSLSILSDDRRVVCHAPTCRLAGRGADAWDLAHLATGAVAR
jgi:hypothetical protein